MVRAAISKKDKQTTAPCERNCGKHLGQPGHSLHFRHNHQRWWNKHGLQENLDQPSLHVWVTLLVGKRRPKSRSFDAFLARLDVKGGEKKFGVQN